jgi:di/tripeptidase
LILIIIIIIINNNNNNKGGTDGCRITLDYNIPCPNIFAGLLLLLLLLLLFKGGENFHSRKEFLPIHSHNKCLELLVNLLPKFL